MTALIDDCEKRRPHPDWAVLRALPYAELSALRNWIEKPFRDEPPKAPPRGLWFGLIQRRSDDDTTIADLHVAGSERFNADVHDNGWAVRPEWCPKSRSAESAVLAAIYRIAYRQNEHSASQPDCLGNDAEYSLCLGYAAFAVRALLAQVEPSLLLGRSQSLGVAVGFNDGDFVLLGRLTPSGLVPIAASQ
ncbi:MAG: hypothetical protein SF069_16210 [Phycisphaerae bacterium]|nr:hypothetical protein [Phycisphaerae bacterium]